MKKYLLLLFLFICVYTYSQNIEQTGIVIDAGTKEPLTGVSVALKGSTTGAFTDLDGKFKLQIPAKSTLVISYIGYISKEVESSGTNLHIELTEKVQQLDEVIVIGFGTAKKSDLTSSISSIKGQELSTMTVGNVNESLQGKVSGVQVVGGGGPGASPKVLIRGFSTVSLDTDPLYVVDGVPVGTNINYLNANDIESMEVLKDASSAAIYGSRASNGVIMITTKRGIEGKTRYNVDLSYGYQYMAKPFKMANAVEYATIFNGAREASGLNPEWNDPASYEGKTTDWWGAGIDKYSPQMNASFSLQGGDAKRRYSLSMNYYKQDSFYEKGGWTKFSARFTNDYTTSKVLSFGYSLTPIYESWGQPSNWGNFVKIDPITPIYKLASELTGDENEYSIYARSPSYIYNPVGEVARWDEEYKRYSLASTAYAQVSLWDKIVLRSQLGVDVDTRVYKKFFPDFVIDAAHEKNEVNRVEREHPLYVNWNLQNTVTYMDVFNEKHNLSLMLGNTLEEYHEEIFKGRISGIPNNMDELRELDAGTINKEVEGRAKTTSIASFLGRIMYNYDTKYYLTATFRTDGSSKFLDNNKWASFPSASLAWRISGEDFMSGTKGFLDDLKLKAGWGRSGNQSLPTGVYLSKIGTGYSVIGGSVVNGNKLSTIKNENIKWETVEDLNLGLDFTLFSSRLSGGIDLYKRKTKDMIFKKTYPFYSGYPGGATIWSNVGSMRSQGIDFNLGYNDNIGGFKYGATFTLTTFDVKMLSLVDDTPIYGYGQKTKMVVGDEPGFYYGYKADGLFQNQAEVDKHSNTEGKKLQPNARPGDIRFADTNGDGVLDAEDRVKLGSPWADVTMGLNLTAEYKNFDLLVNLYASIGNDLVNEVKNDLYNAANQSNKVSGLINKAWHGEGTSNSIPRLVYVDENENYSRFSSIYVEDGSYLRMKNIQLGYTIPKLKYFDKVRVYVAAQNLFTITGYDGIDPEVGGSSSGDESAVLRFGMGGWTYPVQKTFLIGANISF